MDFRLSAPMAFDAFAITVFASCAARVNVSSATRNNAPKTVFNINNSPLILLIAPSSAEERSVAAGGFYHSRFKWMIGFLGFVRTARNEAGQAGDDCYKFQGFYRLRNMHLISGSKRFHAVVNSGQGGQSDCRNTAVPFVADAANEVIAVRLGHTDIGHEDIRRPRVEYMQALLRAARCLDNRAGFIQNEAQQFACIRII